jgi:hypothetical protein
MELLLTPTPTRMKAWLEQAWLGRYLERSLSAEETTWFESYVLDKPELLAMLETDTGLRDALAADPSLLGVRESAAAYASKAGGTAQAQPTGTEDDSTPILLEQRRLARSQRRTAPAWLAIAASLLVGIGVGGVAVRTIAPPAAAPNVIANPTRIIVDTMRGAASAPRVEHADSGSAYVLVDAAVPPGAEHIVLKMDGEPDQVLTPVADGFVTFSVKREALAKSAGARIEYQLLGKETRLPIDFR